MHLGLLPGHLDHHVNGDVNDDNDDGDGDNDDDDDDGDDYDYADGVANMGAPL